MQGNEIEFKGIKTEEERSTCLGTLWIKRRGEEGRDAAACRDKIEGGKPISSRSIWRRGANPDMPSEHVTPKRARSASCPGTVPARHDYLVCNAGTAGIAFHLPLVFFFFFF